MLQIDYYKSVKCKMTKWRPMIRPVQMHYVRYSTLATDNYILSIGAYFIVKIMVYRVIE